MPLRLLAQKVLDGTLAGRLGVGELVFIAPPDSLRKGFSYQTPEGRTLARGHNRIPENCSRVRNIDDKWNL